MSCHGPAVCSLPVSSSSRRSGRTCPRASSCGRRSGTGSTVRRGCSSDRPVPRPDPRMTRLGHLSTEGARPERAEIDRLPTDELVRLMNEDDQAVALAVADARAQIAAAVDAIVPRLRGRRAADLRRRGHGRAARGARRERVRADVQLRPGGRRSSRAGRARCRPRPSRPRTTPPPARTSRSRPRTSSSASPRPGARRTCSARSSTRAPAGALTIGLACNTGSPLSAAVDAPDRGRRRPRVHRRLHAAEGGHGAEARAQHALDAHDGAARARRTGT